MHATESRRDAGLVRAVGTWGLTASVINIVVGAGIFAVPGALAASVGPYAPLAFLACAIAVGAVAICFAEGGSRIATSGGPYGYIEAAFGPLAGYVSGTFLWFSDVLSCGGVAAALADAMVSLLPARYAPAGHAAVIVVVIGGIALVNMGGAKRGAGFVNAATALKLIPLLVFLIVGVTAIHASNFSQIVPPGAEGLGRAVILALFAFTGMETPLSASGEIAQPSRTIPRALAISMLAVTALYIGIQVIAQGILGPSLGHSKVPLADAMAHISPALRLLMLGGAAVSMFGWIGSDLFGSPRILFAFARDGFMPRALGRVHPDTHSPNLAILSYAGLAMVLALTGTFAELAVLAALASTVLYIAGCAAAWTLARKGVALVGTPLNFRWLKTAMVIGIASMLVAIALASRAEIIGLVAVFAIIVASYLLVMAARKRRTFENIIP